MLQLQRRPVSPGESLPASPPAQRGTPSRLRDPRLLLGVALVVVAMVAGALLLGTRSDGLPIVRAARDLPAGVALTPDDFETVIAVVPEGSGYLGEVPGGELRLTRPLRAGEFVDSGVLDAGSVADIRLVTVPVEPLHAPITLTPGMRVDVWATAATEGATPELVLRNVLVAQTSGDSESATGQLGVVLEVPTPDSAALVAATHAGAVDLVAVPDGSGS